MTTEQTTNPTIPNVFGHEGDVLAAFEVNVLEVYETIKHAVPPECTPADVAYAVNMLAGGVDIVWPPENQELYEAIVVGAEYPGTKAAQVRYEAVAREKERQLAADERTLKARRAEHDRLKSAMDPKARKAAAATPPAMCCSRTSPPSCTAWRTRGTPAGT